MDKKVSIIGIGMEGGKCLTKAACNAIADAEVIIGAKRMVESFMDSGKQVFMSYKADETAQYISSSECSRFAVLMSGDCGFYSGCNHLRNVLKDCNVDVISGISSPVYFSSVIGIPWQDWHFVSLHGESANIVRNICANEKTFFLLGGETVAAEICRRLCEFGRGGVQVYIGEQLGYENERVMSGTADELKNVSVSELSVLLAVNETPEKCRQIGIPDGRFIRGRVPMTKSEVRAVCISKLCAKHDSICWDIGAGTGSVSVEMALQCTDGRVYAVDRSQEAISLVRENMRSFGCDNIIPILDDAEKAVDTLPAPDCVFIGGSGGKLRAVISLALKKNPAANIVVTAVTLDTLSSAADILSEHGLDTEVTQVAVTRTKNVGEHTMFAAENPVFIIRGRAE